jgi:hypothetical protein
VTRGIRALTILSLALVAAACSSNAGTPATTAAAPSPPPTAAPPEPPETVDATPALPGQSESEFGTIWDAVPESFPIPADAVEADPDHGPVSGAWTVSVADISAPELAGFYRDGLDDLGWGTTIDGPLEDGSYTVWSSDGYGCETFTRILPRGDESLITAYFGTGCPWR